MFLFIVFFMVLAALVLFVLGDVTNVVVKLIKEK